MPDNRLLCLLSVHYNFRDTTLINIVFKQHCAR